MVVRNFDVLEVCDLVKNSEILWCEFGLKWCV